MGKEGLRSLLVVSARPHPWAYLRDRLRPDLICVAWVRPGLAGPFPAPWAAAGDSFHWPSGIDVLRGRLTLCHWVGTPPPALPASARRHRTWQSVASALDVALRAEVAGARLAPGQGLALPDGSFVSNVPDLETLVASHPQGLAGTAADRRRVAAQLLRSRLPLRVSSHGGRLSLEPVSGGLAS
jgi:hypothetical protein